VKKAGSQREEATLEVKAAGEPTITVLRRFATAADKTLREEENDEQNDETSVSHKELQKAESHSSNTQVFSSGGLNKNLNAIEAESAEHESADHESADHESRGINSFDSFMSAMNDKDMLLFRQMVFDAANKKDDNSKENQPTRSHGGDESVAKSVLKTPLTPLSPPGNNTNQETTGNNYMKTQTTKSVSGAQSVVTTKSLSNKADGQNKSKVDATKRCECGRPDCFTCFFLNPLIEAGDGEALETWNAIENQAAVESGEKACSCEKPGCFYCYFVNPLLEAGKTEEVKQLLELESDTLNLTTPRGQKLRINLSKDFNNKTESRGSGESLGESSDGSHWEMGYKGGKSVGDRSSMGGSSWEVDSRYSLEDCDHD